MSICFPLKTTLTLSCLLMIGENYIPFLRYKNKFLPKIAGKTKVINWVIHIKKNKKNKNNLQSKPLIITY